MRSFYHYHFLYFNGNILDNWTYSISAGGDCDEGWKGAEDWPGYQPFYQVRLGEVEIISVISVDCQVGQCGLVCYQSQERQVRRVQGYIPQWPGSR